MSDIESMPRMSDIKWKMDVSLCRPFHGLDTLCCVSPRVSLRFTLGYMPPPAFAGFNQDGPLPEYVGDNEFFTE